MDKKTQQIAIPFISVLLGILLGAIIMWIFGYDALWGYEELFKTAFGSIKNIGEIFRTMGPLILIALGFAVASRAGFCNVTADCPCSSSCRWFNRFNSGFVESIFRYKRSYCYHYDELYCSFCWK